MAVVVIALIVCASLGLLAWTLGVSITRVLRRTRQGLVGARLELTVAERKLRDTARAMAEAREAREAEARRAREGEPNEGDS